jgi:hypothetical protein
MNNTSSKVGLDKLKLWFKSPKISPKSFILQPAAVNTITGELVNNHFLFQTTDGEPVYGNKAYFNSEYCNVELHDEAAFVSLSVDKLAGGGDNTFPCESKEQAVKVINQAYEHLNDSGFDFDWRHGIPSRIDINRTFQTDKPFRYYPALFVQLNAKYLPKIKDYGVEGCRWQGSSKQIESYDKVSEILKRGAELPAGLPENCMRLEYRVTAGKDACKVFAVPNAEQLIDKWDEYPAIYERELKNHLFRYGAKGEGFENDDKRQKAFNAEYGRQSFQKYLKFRGCSAFVNGYATADDCVHALMRNFGKSEKEANREYKKLRELMLIGGALIVERVSFQELYSEIYDKIAS